LFNRALLAVYPPGSTFKVFNVLVGLQEQVINLNTRFSCSGPSSIPIRCTHNHSTPLGAVDAIRESCNPFMWNTFRAILNKYETTAESFNVWRDYALSFGFGRKLDDETINENKGNVPSEEYYNRIYGSGHWSALTIRSLAIGQGEMGITPLQMANYCAIIANRGYYYIPHVIKEIENETLDSRYETKVYTKISPEYFEPVIKGMEMAVKYSSALSNTRIPGITICGKTGTVENPQGSDHSVFMAFSPKDSPRIAISVYIENGVWGSRYAAPIASLLIEKYLTGTISPNRKRIEKRILDANLLNPNQPK